MYLFIQRFCIILLKFSIDFCFQLYVKNETFETKTNVSFSQLFQKIFIKWDICLIHLRNLF